MLQLYESSHFNMLQLDQALEAKGFQLSIVNYLPEAAALDQMLDETSQLWLVSGYNRQLDSSHLMVLEGRVNEGMGLYVMADNEPYDADADFLARYLCGAEFHGNFMADRQVSSLASSVLSFQENIYEGFTVSAVTVPEGTVPLMVGSQGQVVLAAFQTRYKRILLDGGFTRLFVKWTEHSARFFVEVARWLGSSWAPKRSH